MKFSSYKSRAHKKKMKFNVPEEIFTILEKRPCYYCKIKKDEVGIDRIDNTKGYVSGNCIPCCWDCNRLKSNKTMQEFKEYLIRFNKDLRFYVDPLVVHWFYTYDGEVYTRLAPHSKKLGNTYNTFFADDI